MKIHVYVLSGTRSTSQEKRLPPVCKDGKWIGWIPILELELYLICYENKNNLEKFLIFQFKKVNILSFPVRFSV